MSSAWTRLGLLLAALVLPVCARSFADPFHKVRRTTPAHPARTAPDVTATITKPSPPVLSPPPATSHTDEILPPPFKLPSASRTRVRACGETWRDMKLAGTTGDDDWRDFALKCLTEKNPAAVAN